MIEIFPSRNFEFKIKTDYNIAWNNLTKNTTLSNSLISLKTDKKFIG
jgi:hypothetical protein